MKKITWFFIILVILSTLLTAADKSADKKNKKEKQAQAIPLPVKWSFTLKTDKGLAISDIQIINSDDNSRIYIAAQKKIIVLDSATGIKKEEIKISGRIGSFSVISSGTLYTILDDKELTAIDLSHPKNRKWSFSTGDTDPVSIKIINQSILVVENDGKIYDLDIQTEAQKWNHNLENSVKFGPAVDADNGQIFIIDSVGTAYKINIDNGKVILSRKLETSPCSPILYYKEKIYFGGENGFFISLNADDLSENWAFETITHSITEPKGYKDIICFATLSNQIFCRGRRHGGLEFRLTAKKRFFISPVITGDILFGFPHNEKTVIYDLKNSRLIGWTDQNLELAKEPYAIPEHNLLIIQKIGGTIQALTYKHIVQFVETFDN